MASRHWQTVNHDSDAASQDLSGPFTLQAPPNCDLWRSSETHDAATAPALYTKTVASKFKRLAVTIHYGNFKTQYDQGGIFVWFPSSTDQKPRWLKSGVEMNNSRPYISVVGCDVYSDWSLAPLPSAEAESTVRIEAVREGEALWVYAMNVGGDGEALSKQPLREPKWFFLEERRGEAEMWVGVCCAKPTPDDDDSNRALTVKFENLEVETSE